MFKQVGPCLLYLGHGHNTRHIASLEALEGWAKFVKLKIHGWSLNPSVKSKIIKYQKILKARLHQSCLLRWPMMVPVLWVEFNVILEMQYSLEKLWG